MKTKTYKQVAENYELWCEYVDPHATMTEDEFDALSTEEKIKMQTEMFGDEEKDTDEE